MTLAELMSTVESNLKFLESIAVHDANGPAKPDTSTVTFMVRQQDLAELVADIPPAFFTSGMVQLINPEHVRIMDFRGGRWLNVKVGSGGQGLVVQ